MRIAEKAARILLTVIGLFGLAVFFLPKIGISVDIVMSGSMEPTLKTGGIVFTDTQKNRAICRRYCNVSKCEGKSQSQSSCKTETELHNKG